MELVLVKFDKNELNELIKHLPISELINFFTETLKITF